MRPAAKVEGQEFVSTAEANWERGVERSGVKGPLMCGSRFERLIVMILSYWASGSARRRLDAPGTEAIVEAAVAMELLCVDSR